MNPQQENNNSESVQDVERPIFETDSEFEEEMEAAAEAAEKEMEAAENIEDKEYSENEADDVGLMANKNVPLINKNVPSMPNVQNRPPTPFFFDTAVQPPPGLPQPGIEGRVQNQLQVTKLLFYISSI